MFSGWKDVLVRRCKRIVEVHFRDFVFAPHGAPICRLTRGPAARRSLHHPGAVPQGRGLAVLRICWQRAAGVESGSGIVACAQRDTPTHVRCHRRKLIEVELRRFGALVVGCKWLAGLPLHPEYVI